MHAEDPTLKKEAGSPGTSWNVEVGVATDCNSRWRRTMEDAHLSILDFDNVPGQALFGMFDGHAGKFAAEWCRDNLASILAQELHEHPDMDVREVLNNTYMRADHQLEADSEKAGVRSGCTAVTSLLRVETQREQRQRVLYTANVGDARSVLCRNGKAIRLTYDHKGSDELEARRITEKGGFLLNNRVNGVLAVTRSFGDFSMKEFVVGSPFTTSIALEDNDAFLIVACDGVRFHSNTALGCHQRPGCRGAHRTGD